MFSLPRVSKSVHLVSSFERVFFQCLVLPKSPNLFTRSLLLVPPTPVLVYFSSVLFQSVFFQSVFYLSLQICSLGQLVPFLVTLINLIFQIRFDQPDESDLCHISLLVSQKPNLSVQPDFNFVKLGL